MKFIKELIKNTDLKIKILVFLICAYIGVLASFQDVGAVTELIGYEPAISVQIKDGTNKTMNYLVKRSSLADVLNDLEIKLGKEDTTNIALTDQIDEGAVIEITRVTYEEERIPESVPYTTIYVDSDDPTLFGTRLAIEGQDGEKEIIYKKKMVNGKEVSREEIGSEMIKEPVTEVIEEGTASSGTSFTGRLTRYGADCAGCGTRTAAGLYVTTNGVKDEGKVTLTYNGGEYYVLAADSSIPFGSIVKVSNHGFSLPDPFYGIVLDRGGAVTGTSMDVFCGSESASFFTGGTTYDTQFEIVSMGSGATGIY